MLTIEEAIKHAEEVASEQERLMGRYDAASGYARSRNESIRTEPAKECKKCAEEHLQLSAWLRELQERRKAPEIIFCHECKHWKDSDGVYRRGISAESKCPVNSRQVYEGTFFCGMAERRTDENNNLYV